METLEGRLAALEAEIRAQRRGGELRAPVRIVDEAGHLLLTVEAGEVGPRLLLFDRDGRPRLELTPVPRGGMLAIYNDQAQAMVGLFVDANGGTLRLHHREGEQVVTLGANLAGGELGLFRSDGEICAAVGAAPDGGTLQVRALSAEGDPATDRVATLQATSQGPQLALRWRTGDPELTLSPQALCIYGDEGETVVELGVDAETGKGRLSLPESDSR